jgi:hypothetical protein
VHRHTHARTRTRAYANTSANAHNRIHFRQRRTHTQKAMQPHTFITRTRTRTHRRAHKRAEKRAWDTCLYNSIGRCIYISYGAERATQMESEMTAVRACVRACMRASVWVCARPCARAETYVSLSRERGRLQPYARARACRPLSSPEYTPQPPQYPRVPPRVPVECLLRASRVPVVSRSIQPRTPKVPPRVLLVPLAATWYPGLPLRTPRVPYGSP